MNLRRLFRRMLAKAGQGSMFQPQGSLFGPGPIKNNPALRKEKRVDKRGRLQTKYVRPEEPAKPKPEAASEEPAQGELFTDEHDNGGRQFGGALFAGLDQAEPEPAAKPEPAPAGEDLTDAERELAELLATAIREADERGDRDEARYLRRYLGHMTGDAPSEPESDAEPDEEHGDFDDYGEEIKFSRKHLAQIRSELESKARVMRLSDLDALEQDPAVASMLVSKDSVLGGSMDTLQEVGMTAGGAYLFTKLVSTIPKAPPKDTPRDRRLYVMAVQRVMAMLESTRTVDDVRDGMRGLADLRFGQYVPADMKDESDEISSRLGAARGVYSAIRDDREKHHGILRTANYSRTMARMRAGGNERSDEYRAELAKIEAAEKQAQASLDATEPAFREARKALRAVESDMHAFKERLQKRDDATEYPWSEAMATLGDRFTNYLGIRFGRQKSDSTFRTRQKHIEQAREYEKGDDWGWQGKKAGATKREKVKKPKWERTGPEDAIRVGGQQVEFTSETLAETFGLRGVQYGNWMDEESSREHTQRAGEAFLDLADILGLEPEKVSLHGRLGIGFGARGKGRAKAHYEPGLTVINMTKWKGGGSLAHEWGHFLDNMLGRFSFGGDGGHTTFATEALFGPEPPKAGDLQLLGRDLPPRVMSALEDLRQAVYNGDFVPTRTIEQNEPATRTSHGRTVQVVYRGWALGQRFLQDHGGDPQAAFDAFVEHVDPAGRATERGYKRAVKSIKEAAGWFYAQGGKPVKTEIPEFRGKATTAFAATAEKMGKYWQQPVELFARAFETFVSDELKASGRRNSYLVSGIAKDDVAGWAKANPLIGAERTSPYPRGEERTRINTAMRSLIDALHADDTFAKAIAAYLGSEVGTEGGREA